MGNRTFVDAALPPLPEYSLQLLPSLVPWVSDSLLTVFAPIVVYWIASLYFHIIDVLDLFPQYRIHTPEEITSRNHASRYEVARDVVIQQVIKS